MEPFEYAVKKDVRNNPIVREVDEERQRELWKWARIASSVVLVLLFSAWQHFELLRHGYQLEALQRQQAAEEEITQHLRLEIDTLRSLGHGGPPASRRASSRCRFSIRQTSSLARHFSRRGRGSSPPSVATSSTAKDVSSRRASMPTPSTRFRLKSATNRRSSPVCA